MVTLTVSTWNVENFFSHRDRDDPQWNRSCPRTQKEFDQKRDGLAETINRIKPDVLALQEVGDEQALKDLLVCLPPEYNRSYAIASTIPGDPHPIRVAFVSRLPIETEEEIAAFPDGSLHISYANGGPAKAADTQFKRRLLRITVQLADKSKVTLIAAHLKSKLITYPSRAGVPRYQPLSENERAEEAGKALLTRTGEAVALRVLANKILEAAPETRLIVLGDFNDELQAATTQIIAGPAGSEIGTGAFRVKDAGDSTRLFDVLLAIKDPALRVSRMHEHTPELIDHIFASAALFPGQERRTPVVFCGRSKDEPPLVPSIGSIPGRMQEGLPSDHAPVTAVFEL